jgi:uncharacterized cupredoxin-like copper-binding protein
MTSATSSFVPAHATMLLRYSGISFISGAVNHGFFSTERSFATAGVGVVLFALAAWLEHRAAGVREDAGDVGRTLLWGALLSVGLGFFTGGLQHFPDSPGRSAWVVPLGFVISVAAFVLLEQVRKLRTALVYTLAAGALVVVGSWGTAQWLAAQPAGAGDGHSHSHGEAAPGTGLQAQVVGRTIAVTMDDAMRFTPSQFQVGAGETVRFAVRNAGQVPHEFIVGSEQELTEHAEQMKSGAANHAHGGGAAISLAPGQSGDLVITFGQAGNYQVGCLVPGHYEAGMRGRIDVLAAGAPAASPAAAPAPAASGHDGHDHKH